jgi:deoxycytidylate deaminase
MNTRRDPKEIAETILNRSTCSVQVGAALADSRGVFAWGWNHVGRGFGIHAEDHCLLRANVKRLAGATLYVASRRRRNGKIIMSKPCEHCQMLIDAYPLKRVLWRDSDGKWKEL